MTQMQHKIFIVCLLYTKIIHGSTKVANRHYYIRIKNINIQNYKNFSDQSGIQIRFISRFHFTKTSHTSQLFQ